MSDSKLIVGLAGMPGSGKSLVVETFVKEGYKVVVMGDVVRQEVKKRGLKLNPESVGKIMLYLRRRSGDSIIAHRCIPKIEQQKSEKVIVDGVRSLSEVVVFKKHFSSFSLVAIQASPETRFNRLFRRCRSDDPDGWELFQERDIRELGVGVGNAIAMAEHFVINENRKDTVITNVKEIIRRIERKWKR